MKTLKTILAAICIAVVSYYIIPDVVAAFNPHTEYTVTPPKESPVYVVQPEPVVYPTAVTMPIIPTMQPAPAPTAVLIIQPVQPVPVPTRDWAPEITAVSRNLENAVKLVELCAIKKTEAALQFPPSVVDCRSVLDNLENAKTRVYELQLTIGEGQ